MFKRFKTKRCSFLGVDISPTSVKILEISRHKNQLCIEAYGCKSLIPGESSREQLVSSLQSLLIHSTSSAKIAAVAVPDTAVISRTIQLAENLNATEIEELTLLEAKKYIPCTSNEIYIDFVVLGSTKEALGMVDVLWVASRAENIRKRVEILSEVGLDVKIVGIESQIIAAAASQIVRSQEVNLSSKGLLAVIHIDFTAMYFNFFHSGKLIFSKEEPLDSRRFEATVAKYYEITKETKQGLEDHQRLADYESMIMRPLILPTVLHIKRNLQLFLSANFFGTMEGIFLTGELGGLASIDTEIEKETGFKTAKANLGNMEFSNRIDANYFSKMVPLYALAYGLTGRLAREW